MLEHIGKNIEKCTDFQKLNLKKSFPCHISLSLPRHNKLVIEINLTLTSHGEGNGEVGEESLIRP